MDFPWDSGIFRFRHVRHTGHGTWRDSMVATSIRGEMPKMPRSAWRMAKNRTSIDDLHWFTMI
jgi:hypothetical protein